MLAKRALMNSTIAMMQDPKAMEPMLYLSSQLTPWPKSAFPLSSPLKLKYHWAQPTMMMYWAAQVKKATGGEIRG